MPPPYNEFKQRLLIRLGRAAVEYSRPAVAKASRTLASALRVRVNPTRFDRVSVYVPHYYAVFVHEGRRPFTKETFMVWFRDPKDDPRLRGGKTPQRVKNLRHLTPQQFKAAIRLRNEHIDAGGDPYDSPVIITKSIRRGTPAKRFFGNRPSEGMFGFVNTANQVGLNEFNAFVRREMGDGFKETLETNARI